MVERYKGCLIPGGMFREHEMVMASDYDALAADHASQVAWKDRYLRGYLAAHERVTQLEAALREVQTRWWPGCKDIQDRIAGLLGNAAETDAKRTPHFPGNETLRRQIESDPDEDPSVP